MRREKLLPFYEGRRDDQGRATTMAGIARNLAALGQLDEALRILRDDVLPVWDRFGDVVSRAATMGQIAEILAERGRLDEAVRIRREEELPVYDRVGLAHARLVSRANLALTLLARGADADREQASRLLQRSYAAARVLRTTQVAWIEAVAKENGLTIVDS